MLPPLDTSVKSFYALARELHEKNRFFPHRRAIAAGPIPVISTHAARRVSISAAAVPYRPNRGLYVVVGQTDAGSTLDSCIGDVLELPGVAGIWAFGPGGTTPATRTSLAAPVGSERLDEEIVVVYLDDDPLETARGIEYVLSPGWENFRCRAAFWPDHSRRSARGRGTGSRMIVTRMVLPKMEGRSHRRSESDRGSSGDI